MPPITKVYETFGSFIEKGAVIRLHGPDRKRIEEKSGTLWNKIVDNRDDELTGILRMIRDLISRKIDAYVNVNNHYEGSAPLTIEKIRERLGEDSGNTVIASQKRKVSV